MEPTFICDAGLLESEPTWKRLHAVSSTDGKKLGCVYAAAGTFRTCYFTKGDWLPEFSGLWWSEVGRSLAESEQEAMVLAEAYIAAA